MVRFSESTSGGENFFSFNMRNGLPEQRILSYVSALSGSELIPVEIGGLGSQTSKVSILIVFMGKFI